MARRLAIALGENAGPGDAGRVRDTVPRGVLAACSFPRGNGRQNTRGHETSALSSAAAMGPRAKAKPDCYKPTGGPVAAASLAPDAELARRQGVGLGVGVDLLLVKRPGAVQITALALA
jgi:hypothetical protein